MVLKELEGQGVQVTLIATTPGGVGASSQPQHETIMGVLESFDEHWVKVKGGMLVSYIPTASILWIRPSPQGAG